MKRICLAILFCLIYSGGFSQNQKIVDSLKYVLKSGNDTSAILALAELSVQYRTIDTDSAYNYGQEGLKRAQKNKWAKGIAANLFSLGWVCLSQSKFDEAIADFNKAMEIMEADGNKKGVPACYGKIGMAYFYQGTFDKSLEFQMKALHVAESLVSSSNPVTVLEGKKEMADCYNNIGSIHISQANYDKAIEYYTKSLDFNKELGNKKGMSKNYNNLGIIYWNLNQFDLAADLYQKSILINEELGDKNAVADCYSNLGSIYLYSGKYSHANGMYQKALVLKKGFGDKHGQSVILGNMAELNIKMRKYQEAINYAKQSLVLAKEIGSLDDESFAYQNLSAAYDSISNPTEALKYIRMFIAVKDSMFKEEKTNALTEMDAKYQNEAKQKEIDLQKVTIKAKEEEGRRKDTQRNALIFGLILVLLLLGLLFTIYSQKKKANVILTLQKTEIENANRELEKLSLVASETTNAVTIADANGNLLWLNRGFEKLHGYGIEQLINEKGGTIYEASSNPNLKNLTEEAIQTRSSISYVSNYLEQQGSIWIQTTLTPIFKDDKLHRIVLIDSDISLLKMAETEISAQRDLLEKKNKRIVESIRYAKRIQQSILPNQSLIKKHFENSFVFYQPKDIVSGDMYWMQEVGEEVLFSVIDCTGHGVPGAFMTIFAYNLLDAIVSQLGITKPSEVVGKLNQKLEEYRKNSDEKVDDGMELMLCSYNKSKGLLQCAGAFSSLYFIRDGEMTEYKGDLIPIGNTTLLGNNYTNYEINIQRGDSLYMFTDGYVDQKGGPAGKKFFLKPFRELLLTVENKLPNERLEIISTTINNWKQSTEQMDDMCVLGIRF